MKLSHALLLPFGPEAYAELRAMYAAAGADPARVTGSTVEARALAMRYEHELALAAMPALPGVAPESETPAG